MGNGLLCILLSFANASYISVRRAKVCDLFLLSFTSYCVLPPPLSPGSSPPFKFLSPSLPPCSLALCLTCFLPPPTPLFHRSRSPSLRNKHVFLLFFNRYHTQVERQEARRDGMTEHMAVLLFVMKVRVCLGAPVPSLSNARACT